MNNNNYLCLFVGDFNSCLKYLKISICATSNIYGESSIEHAHEQHKLAGVLLQCKEMDASYEAALKAYQIVCLNYGKAHQESLEIKKLMDQIDNAKRIRR